MAERFSRGTLTTEPPPVSGERFERVVRLPGASVMLITSSSEPEPVDYTQFGDEWVVVLSGSATLEVDGDPVSLGAGDWVLLPARVPHRVVATDAGTRWLAIHSPSGDEDAPDELRD